MWKLDNYI